MKNKLLMLCGMVITVLAVFMLKNDARILQFVTVFFKRQQSTEMQYCRASQSDELQNSAQNVEDDLMLIEALNKDPHTSLAQKEEMAQALVQDLESLELQENKNLSQADKKKFKSKKKAGKGSAQSVGRVQRSLTPAQARRAIEIITTEIIDVNNTKSLDEHFAEMISLSECLDPKVKADVAARKAVEYVKNNKYLITKDLSTWEKVSKGPFVYAAYCGLPKSKEFVELYERDAELFRKILASKDTIKS